MEQQPGLDVDGHVVYECVLRRLPEVPHRHLPGKLLQLLNLARIAGRAPEQQANDARRRRVPAFPCFSVLPHFDQHVV
jgi:hypothetical protein